MSLMFTWSDEVTSVRLNFLLTNKKHHTAAPLHDNFRKINVFFIFTALKIQWFKITYAAAESTHSVMDGATGGRDDKEKIGRWTEGKQGAS